MLFTDIIFALFMGCFFCIYWFALRKSLRWQNVWLLGASYLFYGWWDWRFLILIILTSATTFFSAVLFERYRHKWLITANIVFNLGILALFKYFNFFTENIGRLFSLAGMNLDWFTIDVLLPVGISFYTFQAISYSIDVSRGDIRPTRNVLGFMTFIA
ncbi:MAG: MBOAT family protein, partial [Paramuribaculum sp.]|nr:MBOAT family protein [Paramuribaculum sp.]